MAARRRAHRRRTRRSETGPIKRVAVSTRCLPKASGGLPGAPGRLSMVACRGAEAARSGPEAAWTSGRRRWRLCRSFQRSGQCFRQFAQRCSKAGQSFRRSAAARLSARSAWPAPVPDFSGPRCAASRHWSRAGPPRPPAIHAPAPRSASPEPVPDRHPRTKQPSKRSATLAAWNASP